MSIPLILILSAASLFLVEFMLLFLKKTKDSKPVEKSNPGGIHEESTCIEAENCWCMEYDLTKEKKETILKELGDQNCGKTISSIVANV